MTGGQWGTFWNCPLLGDILNLSLECPFVPHLGNSLLNTQIYVLAKIVPFRLHQEPWTGQYFPLPIGRGICPNVQLLGV